MAKSAFSLMWRLGKRITYRDDECSENMGSFVLSFGKNLSRLVFFSEVLYIKSNKRNFLQFRVKGEREVIAKV